MLNKIASLLVITLVACFVGCTAPTTESTCSVERVDGGVVMTCPDGSEAFLSDGEEGDKGTRGLHGLDGADGKDGVDGVDGRDGVDGIDGTDGEDGTDGVTCRAIEALHGPYHRRIDIICSDGFFLSYIEEHCQANSTMVDDVCVCGLGMYEYFLDDGLSECRIDACTDQLDENRYNDGTCDRDCGNYDEDCRAADEPAGS